MNLKKALLVTLSAGLIVTSMNYTNIVSAEGTYESNATVTFTLPEDSVSELVDPLDPSQPLDMSSVDGEPTGDGDPLSLDFVTNLDFGSQQVDLDGGTYGATTETPYIQVTDIRGPNNSWNVTAAVSPFSDGDTSTLPGSTISLDNGEAVAASESPTLAPDVVQGVTLPTTGEAVNIVSSDGGAQDEAQGLGTWIIRWLSQNEETERNESVTLNVPASSATEGDHVATIDWTLTDGPGVE